jgi:hypothetical protein
MQREDLYEMWFHVFWSWFGGDQTLRLLAVFVFISVMEDFFW